MRIEREKRSKEREIAQMIEEKKQGRVHYAQVNEMVDRIY